MDNDRHQELINATKARTAKLIKASEEDDLQSLREEAKRWIDAIKPDLLVHMAAPVIGFKILRGEDTRPLVELSLRAEQNGGDCEGLREIIKAWIDVEPDNQYLKFFISPHLIGTSVMFAEYRASKKEAIEAGESIPSFILTKRITELGRAKDKEIE
jgi:hypothetical protein